MITHPKSSPIETVCQLLPPSSQFYQRPQCTHFFSCSLSYPLLFLFSKLTPFAKSGKVCFCCLHQMTLIDTAPKTNCKLYPRKSINCLQLPKSNFPGLKMLRSTGHLLYFMEAQEVGLVCIFTASKNQNGDCNQERSSHQKSFLTESQNSEFIRNYVI